MPETTAKPWLREIGGGHIISTINDIFLETCATYFWDSTGQRVKISSL